MTLDIDEELPTDKFEITNKRTGLVLSFDSQILTSLMACPRQCFNRFTRNLRKKGGKSNSIEIGSLAHIILEFFYKARIQGLSRNAAIEVGYAAAKEYIVPFNPLNKYVTDPDHPGLINTPEESRTVGKLEFIGWKYVFDTMDQYFKFTVNDTFIPIAAEQVRGHIIYEDAEIIIFYKAKYDLIDETPGGLLPTDHKTMKQRTDFIDLNNQFMGQCILLGVRQIRINKIGWQKSLKPEEKFTREYLPYSIDRLAEWANEIVPHYARMYLAYTESGYWPPQFTSCKGKYGNCDYVEACRADRGLRELTFIAHYEVGKPWDISND